MLGLLTDDVADDVSQSQHETSKAAFGRFLEHMDLCYRERLVAESHGAPSPASIAAWSASVSTPNVRGDKIFVWRMLYANGDLIRNYVAALQQFLTHFAWKPRFPALSAGRLGTKAEKAEDEKKPGPKTRPSRSGRLNVWER